MAIDDLVPLLPLLILGATVIVVLAATPFFKKSRFPFSLTIFGLVISFFSLFVISSDIGFRAISGPLWVVDRYGIYFMGLCFLASVIILFFSYPVSEHKEANEFYLFVLIATLGASAMVVSRHFASFFLGLEILSVSLYSMISYSREESKAIEAGIKYLILAGVSAGLLLFGISLVYAVLGSLEIDQVMARLSGNSDLLLWTGVILFFSGIAFKLALAPFHIWSPDVYEGAPAPVVAFIATVSKGAVFSFLFRYFSTGGATIERTVVFLAILSMLVGNFLALLQTNLKRLLAASSISQFGYLIVLLLVGGGSGVHVSSFYLLSYFMSVLIFLGVIVEYSGKNGEKNQIQDYEGLFWQRPFLATALGLSVLSLAGIPITSGFIAKFLLIAAGVKAELWDLVFILVLSSAIGFYYYLKVIVTLFKMPSETEEKITVPVRISASGTVILFILSVLVVLLGVFPSQVFWVIEGMGP